MASGYGALRENEKRSDFGFFLLFESRPRENVIRPGLVDIFQKSVTIL